MSDPTSDEFIAIINRLFELVSSNDEVVKGLQEADLPQRWEFTDLGLVVNGRVAQPEDDSDGPLHWVWSDRVCWEPKVILSMASAVALRFFSGRENPAMAVMRRRVKVSGDVKGLVSLAPVLKPVFDPFHHFLETNYPDLASE